MGSSTYPGALDDFAAATVTPTTTKTGTNDSTGRPHSRRHDDLEAAMEAVQGELGTAPSGGFATVKARLESIGGFNVKDYGALGNDSQDDTSYIQSALTAGAGATVVIPPGTYKITDGLTVSANTTVTGTGTIHQTVSGKAGLIVSGSGVTIEGITLKGRHASASYSGSEHAIRAEAPSTGSRYTKVNVRNVTMTLWGYSALNFRWINDWMITGCRITDIGYTGMNILSCEDGIIDSNRVDNITPGTATNMYGIALTKAVSGDTRSSRIVVSNNTVSRVLWEAIDTHGGIHVTITGNVLYDNADNIALVAGPDDDQPTDISVTGNVIFNTSTGAAPAKNGGIRCWGNGQGTPSRASGIVITGNTFRQLREGISLYNTQGALISGNNFVNGNGAGVSMYDQNFRVAIIGNSFTDQWHASENTSAIEVSGNGNATGFVVGNVLTRGELVDSGYYINDFGIRVIGTTGVSLMMGQNDFAAAEAYNIYAADMSVFKTGGWQDKDPVSLSAAYSVSNLTTDRSLDANGTLDQVADVLGTLIGDLRALGLIG